MTKRRLHSGVSWAGACLTGERATVLWATVPVYAMEPCWEGAEGVLAALGLHSTRAGRCLGGRSSFAAEERTSTSDSEPDEWRMRGRRLFACVGVRWAVGEASCGGGGEGGGGCDCGCGGAWRAREPGVLVCGIHSSDRSSSHGWVELAMAVSGAGEGAGGRADSEAGAAHTGERAGAVGGRGGGCRDGGGGVGVSVGVVVFFGCGGGVEVVLCGVGGQRVDLSLWLEQHHTAHDRDLLAACARAIGH